MLRGKSSWTELGLDSIQSGIWATFLSFCAIFLLIMLFYGGFGIFAIIGLIFNVGFILVFMSIFDMTLTLPGIAGIALTMGMAVDANVLINERIREEWREKNKLLYALDQGYRRAMTSILDGNITTLLGGILLYIFGTGSIRGFALTLMMGLCLSMFTSIILVRAYISLWIHLFKPHKLSL